MKDKNKILKHYEEYKYLLEYDKHPWFIDDNGTIRFTPNPVIHKIIEPYNLNDLWYWLEDCNIEIKHMMEIYRQIGYSFGGFIEIFANKMEIPEVPE